MAKKIIGKTDILDLKELNILNIPAKIDSGAYKSVIHCDQFKEKDGYLFFKLKKHPNFEFKDKEYKTKLYKQDEITSSNGISEMRYMITTSIVIFDKVYETEFSLTDRSDMEYPILLGRMILKDFLIDVTVKNLSFKEKYIKKHS